MRPSARGRLLPGARQPLPGRYDRSPLHRDGRGGKRRGGKGRRGRRGKRFDRHDKNGDGALTQDEVPAKVWERISQADADGNGAVTKEELKAHFKEKRGGK